MTTTDSFNWLSYSERLEHRPVEAIDLVVIHCTELPDLATAREFGERIVYPASGTGNSGHYYLEEDGRLHQWVPVERVAHHVRGYNQRSLGIELCNTGRYPDWFNSRCQQMEHAYTVAQLDKLEQLLDELTDMLPSLKLISGHEHLDKQQVAASDNCAVQVRRKCDPGPLFPWPRVLEATQLQFFDPADTHLPTALPPNDSRS